MSQFKNIAKGTLLILLRTLDDLGPSINHVVLDIEGGGGGGN